MTAEAYEIVTMKKSQIKDLISVEVKCSHCSHGLYTATHSKYAGRQRTWMADHIAQHNDPTRALDITVDWDISAYCSVCDDGIGDVQVNDIESIQCVVCGTTWSIDGKDGELADE